MGLCVLGVRRYALARVLNSLWVEGSLDCNGRGNGIVECVAVAILLYSSCELGVA